MASSATSLLDAVRFLYGCDDLNALPRRMSEALRGLVPCDVVGYAEVNSAFRRTVVTGDVPEVARRAVEVNPALEHFIDEHPLIEHFHNNPEGPVARLTDFRSPRQMRQTGLYCEYLHPLDIEYQAAIELESRPDLSVALTLNRFSSDFTRRECDRLEAFCPHLREAYRHALLREQFRQRLADEAAALEELGIGICTVTHVGRLVDETVFVRNALTATFDGRAGRSDVLPPALKDWVIATHRRFLSAEDPRAVNTSSLFRSAKGTLVVRILRIHEVRGEITLLLRFHEHFDPIARLRRDGLTRREAEVLFRLTLGETDKEIARQLGIHRDTARTHVERIRRKLDVSTRTAAARIALGWLQGPE